jgi:hypothetical protein
MRNSCNAFRWIGRACVVVLLLSFGSLAPAQTNHETKEGDRAPDFSIRADSGMHIAPSGSCLRSRALGANSNRRAWWLSRSAGIRTPRNIDGS